jgi:preprotein translocase subunit YajC
MNNVWIIAQTDADQAPSQIMGEPIDNSQTTTQTAADPNKGPVQETPRTGIPPQFILLGVMFLLMYFVLFRGPKKKQQQHRQMVQSLQKNDRVRTIGGIMGTVMDIKGDEVVLKIDEANNTKIRVCTSAIGKTLSRDEEKE